MNEQGVLVTGERKRMVELEIEHDVHEPSLISCDVSSRWCVYLNCDTPKPAHCYHIKPESPPRAAVATTAAARLLAHIFTPKEWEPDLDTMVVALDGVWALRIDLSLIDEFDDGDHLIVPWTVVVRAREL